MELVFGYLAGVLTLLNPCVLPILPVVLVTAIQQSRLGPLALAAGMGLTFVVVGLSVAAIGPAIGVDTVMVAQIGAGLMIAFGVVLLVPRFSARFALASGGVAGAADGQLDRMDTSGVRGQFLTGMLLGVVWAPCIGPTLGGAIALASQGENLAWAGAIMTTFALGIGTVIVALAYGTREALMRRRDRARRMAEIAKPVTGVILITVGITILFGLHYVIEAALLDLMPAWLQNLSVSI